MRRSNAAGRVDALGLRVCRDFIVNALQDDELLVEMPRQKLCGVAELAFGGVDRAVAELKDEAPRAHHDREHDPDTAEDQPLDRADPAK